MKIGILTVSDRAARGEYEDKSGPLLEDIVRRKTPWELFPRAVVADDVQAIVAALVALCDRGANLVLTNGGTGFAARDVTPEATQQVIEREAPGIAEALRSESLKITRHAMLSRATAGIRGSTLIINLPGNPKAVKENMDILLPVLPHALQLLSGSDDAEGSHRAL